MSESDREGPILRRPWPLGAVASEGWRELLKSERNDLLYFVIHYTFSFPNF
jgi:hypothetical protein